MHSVTEDTIKKLRLLKVTSIYSCFQYFRIQRVDEMKSMGQKSTELTCSKGCKKDHHYIIKGW